ncbi:HAMP domain-containing sensor histidine kinase [Anoxynatronum buryatiense]|uniref:histidine kinase n=1 Tax=Anoxynatronum buryatiense TaxID=489973 RepID=A0AA45WW57_9CLOT|nr:HAMP domain-containing sensor histidine kinase [Anoxynatronum buryatiense]SMP57283.1 Signal transduction histidine kinase [Anoxynatronum buryatiense]
MTKHKVPPRTALTILFAIMIFIILSLTMFIVGILVFILVRTGIINKLGPPNALIPIMLLAFASILVGTLVGTIISRAPLRPATLLINGMNRLASGDYKARIDLGNLSIAREITTSFNTLAEELQHTEMLRSDFVNNFSHELKTPLISIRGFAKLLQKKHLSSEQQQEYLAIIVDESTRLCDMSTSVLNLAKVENQSILTDTADFNLSEQLRSCILLFEKKWSQKNLTIRADFEEHPVHANEDLLKQVWINLIDNAIKFSPDTGEIHVFISEPLSSDEITVSVKNNGPMISTENQNRIFNKFWQGDTSHSSEGSGIGLSIARRITELHKGNISVVSSPEETIFSVTLPR